MNNTQKHTQLNNLIKEFKSLKNKVYKNRIDEVCALLNNSNEIVVSCFEMMQHDFKENSHSNVLKHIFSHEVWNEGKQVLKLFIKKAFEEDEEKAKYLNSLIDKKNYSIIREYSFENGRIDLLIKDVENKFVIVIENKFFANIAVKEYNENNTITKTQLTNYKNYIDKKYITFKRYYILLSLKNYEEKIEKGFIHANYKMLYDILIGIKTEDNIVNEYKVLLKSILSPYFDKDWLLNLKENLKKETVFHLLNDIELAKQYLK